MKVREREERKELILRTLKVCGSRIHYVKGDWEKSSTVILGIDDRAINSPHDTEVELRELEIALYDIYGIKLPPVIQHQKE